MAITGSFGANGARRGVKDEGRFWDRSRMQDKFDNDPGPKWSTIVGRKEAHGSPSTFWAFVMTVICTCKVSTLSTRSE